MRDDLPASSQIRWLTVYNASGETIPAFAAMRVSGLVASTLEYSVSKPNANDAVNNILFNGPVEILASHYGAATADMPATARYDTGDGTPANGDEWGVASGDWKLRNARSGFTIQGAIDSTFGSAVVVRNPTAAAGSFTVAGRTGTQTIASGDTLTLNNGVVSATDTWTPDTASASLAGIVSTGTQTFAGVKTFEQNIIVGSIAPTALYHQNKLEWGLGEAGNYEATVEQITVGGSQVFDFTLLDNVAAYSADPRFRLNGQIMETGTDAIGNVYVGGLLKTIGGGTAFTDEAAQDATGNILVSSTRILATYNDGVPSIVHDLITDTITAGYLHATQTEMLFGRTTAGAGGGEEITMGTSMAIVAGVLDVDVVDGGTF